MMTKNETKSCCSSSLKKSTAFAVDPICGMKIDPAKSLSAIKDGTVHYFCSGTCLAQWSTDEDHG